MPGQIESSRRDPLAPARRPALIVVICFILGIALHASLPHDPQIWLALLVVLGIGAMFFFHLPRLCGTILMLALICAGVAIAQIEAFYYPANHISAYATDEPRLAWLELYIDYEPRVLSDPFSARPLPPKQVLAARVTRVKTWNGWVDCHGQMLVQIAQPHPRLALNQTIRVIGTLERPAPAMNPGQFNWADYYREQRILTSLHITQAQNITILSTTRAGPLDRLRTHSRELLAEGFPANRTLDF